MGSVEDTLSDNSRRINVGILKTWQDEIDRSETVQGSLPHLRSFDVLVRSMDEKVTQIATRTNSLEEKLEGDVKDLHSEVENNQIDVKQRFDAFSAEMENFKREGANGMDIADKLNDDMKAHMDKMSSLAIEKENQQEEIDNRSRIWQQTMEEKLGESLKTNTTVSSFEKNLSKINDRLERLENKTTKEMVKTNDDDSMRKSPNNVMQNMRDMSDNENEAMRDSPMDIAKITVEYEERLDILRGEIEKVREEIYGKLNGVQEMLQQYNIKLVSIQDDKETFKEHLFQVEAKLNDTVQCVSSNDECDKKRSENVIISTIQQSEIPNEKYATLDNKLATLSKEMSTANTSIKSSLEHFRNELWLNTDKFMSINEKEKASFEEMENIKSMVKQLETEKVSTKEMENMKSWIQDIEKEKASTKEIEHMKSWINEFEKEKVYTEEMDGMKLRIKELEKAKQDIPKPKMKSEDNNLQSQLDAISQNASKIEERLNSCETNEQLITLKETMDTHLQEIREQLQLSSSKGVSSEENHQKQIQSLRLDIQSLKENSKSKDEGTKNEVKREDEKDLDMKKELENIKERILFLESEIKNPDVPRGVSHMKENFLITTHAPVASTTHKDVVSMNQKSVEGRKDTGLSELSDEVFSKTNTTEEYICKDGEALTLDDESDVNEEKRCSVKQLQSEVQQCLQDIIQINQWRHNMEKQREPMEFEYSDNWRNWSCSGEILVGEGEGATTLAEWDTLDEIVKREDVTRIVEKLHSHMKNNFSKTNTTMRHLYEELKHLKTGDHMQINDSERIESVEVSMFESCGKLHDRMSTCEGNAEELSNRVEAYEELIRELKGQICTREESKANHIDAIEEKKKSLLEGETLNLAGNESSEVKEQSINKELQERLHKCELRFDDIEQLRDNVKQFQLICETTKSLETRIQTCEKGEHLHQRISKCEEMFKNALRLSHTVQECEKNFTWLKNQFEEGRYNTERKICELKENFSVRKNYATNENDTQQTPDKSSSETSEQTSEYFGEKDAVESESVQRLEEWENGRIKKDFNELMSRISSFEQSVDYRLKELINIKSSHEDSSQVQPINLDDENIIEIKNLQKNIEKNTSQIEQIQKNVAGDKIQIRLMQMYIDEKKSQVEKPQEYEENKIQSQQPQQNVGDDREGKLLVKQQPTTLDEGSHFQKLNNDVSELKTWRNTITYNNDIIEECSKVVTSIRNDLTELVGRIDVIEETAVTGRLDTLVTPIVYESTMQIRDELTDLVTRLSALEDKGNNGKYGLPVILSPQENNLELKQAEESLPEEMVSIVNQSLEKTKNEEESFTRVIAEEISNDTMTENTVGEGINFITLLNRVVELESVLQQNHQTLNEKVSREVEQLKKKQLDLNRTFEQHLVEKESTLKRVENVETYLQGNYKQLSGEVVEEITSIKLRIDDEVVQLTNNMSSLEEMVIHINENYKEIKVRDSLVENLSTQTISDDISKKEELANEALPLVVRRLEDAERNIELLMECDKYAQNEENDEIEDRENKLANTSSNLYELIEVNRQDILSLKETARKTNEEFIRNDHQLDYIEYQDSSEATSRYFLWSQGEDEELDEVEKLNKRVNWIEEFVTNNTHHLNDKVEAANR